jgi:hypothetical protein
MSNPLVTIDASVSDPIAVWMTAHAAVLRVAPRAHEDAVLAVARALVKHGTLAQADVRNLVIDADPIARALRKDMQRGKRPARPRARKTEKKGAKLN